MKKKTTHKKATSGTILYRSETNKVIGGVAGGLGEVFNIDPTLIRVLFLLAFFFGGSGVLLYLILWIVVPSKSKVNSASSDNVRDNLDEVKNTAQSFTKSFGKRTDNTKLLVGGTIILLGTVFLLNNFGFARYLNLHKVWPLFLIALGFVLLTRKDQK